MILRASFLLLACCGSALGQNAERTRPFPGIEQLEGIYGEQLARERTAR